MERDTQLAVSDVKISRGVKELVEERTSLFLGAGIVRLEHGHQLALGLVGHHLDEIAEVLAFGGQLDDRPLAGVLDLDTMG